MQAPMDKLNLKQTLLTGLPLGLNEGKTGLFHWRAERWDTDNPVAYFHPNNSCHTTVSHGWDLGILSSIP